MNSLVHNIEKEYLKKSVSKFNVGDLVKVSIKVVEGDKERLQAFEGRVIARKNGGLRETFTVRRVSLGVGIERVFLLHSPRIDKIEVIKRGKVRRAKLYYLRNLSGNAAKIKEVKDSRGKKTKPATESKDKVTTTKVPEAPKAKETKPKK
jgi:large subunit ribosomal protein L19